MTKFIVIDGKRYAWREILKLRREQARAERQSQIALFELKTDIRPPSQQRADGRYQEPQLFP